MTARIVRVFVAVLGAAAAACASMPAAVQVLPENRTIVHVGEVAALHLAADQYFIGWSAGGHLSLVKHSSQNHRDAYFYRAIAVGDETIIVMPKEMRSGDCVSCRTVHYFLTVVP